MKTIAIDMDEVMADFNSELLARYNDRYHDSLTLASLKGIRIQELKPELADEIDEMINQDSFFRHLHIMENSQAVIKRLSEKFEIFIASAAMAHSRSFDAKYYWLKKNFPFIHSNNIVFCGDKSIIHADYLIDDHAFHFLSFSGQGILFTSPHNINVTGYPRVNSWLEVGSYFDKIS